jgi:recombination protein RecT
MSKALQLRQQFADHVRSDDFQEKLKAELPSDVSLDRFTNVVIRAVNEEPALLAVDNKRSLFLACQRAAQDGLIPDKREGALVTYNIKTDGHWQTAVQWQPMIGGLRKRLALAGFDLRARVVCEFDDFDYQLGDIEQVLHKPPPLNEERGEIIGAYAIAERGGKKYREVMTRKEIDQVRAVSRSGDKGPWGQWFAEMAKKTVAKRLIKSLPLYDIEDQEQRQRIAHLEGIISRDNEDYDLEGSGQPQSEASELQQQLIAGKKKATKKKAPKRKVVRRKAGSSVPEPLEGEVLGSSTNIDEDQDGTPPDSPEESDEDEGEEFTGIDPGF